MVDIKKKISQYPNQITAEPGAKLLYENAAADNNFNQTFSDLKTAVGITDGDKGDIIVSGDGTVFDIEADAVTEGKILDGAVTEDKIDDNAVTTDKILNDAVNDDKLSHTAVTPAAYTLGNFTVNQQGRLTAAESGVRTGEILVATGMLKNAIAYQSQVISPAFPSGDVKVFLTLEISSLTGAFKNKVFAAIQSTTLSSFQWQVHQSGDDVTGTVKLYWMAIV